MMKIKKMFFWLATVGIGGLAVFFIMTSLYIGSTAKSRCREAQKAYRGDLPAGRQDCVEALIDLLNDEGQNYRARNSAIWALGQLGDKRALPLLQSYYTSNIPAKELYDKGISQHELKKAINLVSGGLNATAIFWREK